MKVLDAVVRGPFPEQLGFWALHGVLCATPSFLWALRLGYAVGGMLAGVAGLVLAYAAVTATRWHRDGWGGGDFGRWVRRMVVVRSAVAVIATIGLLQPEPGQVLVVPFTLADLYPGMLAATVGGALWEVRPAHDPAIAFAPTLFTTVLQGLLVSLEFVLLAALVTGGRALARRVAGGARRLVS